MGASLPRFRSDQGWNVQDRRLRQRTCRRQFGQCLDHQQIGQFRSWASRRAV